MTYRERILAIPQSFTFRPELINGPVPPKKKIILIGMGGSRIGPDILNMLWPEKEFIIHSEYGLPRVSQETLQSALIIANSYSGSTAETVSAAQEAIAKGLSLAIVSSGGTLIELAQKYSLPHVKIPAGDPPRLAVDVDLMALALLCDLDSSDLVSCTAIDAAALEKTGAGIAEKIKNTIALVYTPARYNELGYIWKTILNETGKLPAFANRFSELTHNEISGFLDRTDLPARFSCIALDDVNDVESQWQKSWVKEAYTQKGITTIPLMLEGSSEAEKIVKSLILAHWTALAVAEETSVDPIVDPAIAELKRHAY